MRRVVPRPDAPGVACEVTVVGPQVDRASRDPAIGVLGGQVVTQGAVPRVHRRQRMQRTLTGRIEIFGPIGAAGGDRARRGRRRALRGGSRREGDCQRQAGAADQMTPWPGQRFGSDAHGNHATPICFIQAALSQKTNSISILPSLFQWE